MYFTGLGFCSSLLHAASGHPKIAMVVGLMGLATTAGVSTLPTSVGAERTLQLAEERMEAQHPDIYSRADSALLRFEEREEVDISDDQIQYVLDQLDCTICSVEDIRKDTDLLNGVARLYYADVYNRLGENAALVILD